MHINPQVYPEHIKDMLGDRDSRSGSHAAQRLSGSGSRSGSRGAFALASKDSSFVGRSETLLTQTGGAMVLEDM